MGFGTSATEVVLFIGSVIVAASVAGILGMTALDMSAGLREKGEAMKDRLSTDFRIVNDPENIPVIGGNYTFYIKNTGSTSFYFTNTTVSVLIDGQMFTASRLVFTSSDNTSLKRAEVGSIMVNTTLTSGYHTLRVVLHNGIARELTFKV